MGQRYSEPESDGKTRGSGVVEEGNSILKRKGSHLQQKMYKQNNLSLPMWDDDIKLDDGEGSDIGSELTEEMNQNVEVKARRRRK